MILYLVQHGEAKSEAEDPERSLTEAGAAVVERMADWATRTGLVVEQIRHSGKRRAEQTASILAKRLKPAQGVAAIGGLNPGDDVRATAKNLQSDQGQVMLVGHLPHLRNGPGITSRSSRNQDQVVARSPDLATWPTEGLQPQARRETYGPADGGVWRPARTANLKSGSYFRPVP